MTLHTRDSEDMEKGAASSAADPLSALPSVGSWIEVVQGVYIGEIAHVRKVEKEIGMVHASVVPWSLRSMLNRSQFDGFTQRQPSDKRPSFILSKEVVQKWMRDPTAGTTFEKGELGMIIVHHQNIKRIFPQSVRMHKERTENLFRSLTIGLLVRLSNPIDHNEKNPKTKYIVLRFLQAGYVLLCKKKLLKDSKHEDAMLVKSILLDKDMLADETTFLLECEPEAEILAENGNKAGSEVAIFLLVHSSELIPTVGKPGERVLICDGRLSEKSRKAISISHGGALDRSGDNISQCAEIKSKDKETSTVTVRLLGKQPNSTHDTPVVLRFDEVCSFIQLGA